MAQETINALTALRIESLVRREVLPFLWVNLSIEEV
jgi:hypothetical protein